MTENVAMSVSVPETRLVSVLSNMVATLSTSLVKRLMISPWLSLSKNLTGSRSILANRSRRSFAIAFCEMVSMIFAWAYCITTCTP